MKVLFSFSLRSFPLIITFYSLEPLSLWFGSLSLTDLRSPIVLKFLPRLWILSLDKFVIHRTTTHQKSSYPFLNDRSLYEWRTTLILI